MAKTKKSFDAREAAKSIMTVMKRMGLDMSHLDGNQHWFGSRDDWTVDHAKICLGNNMMFILVRAEGFSLYSRAGSGGYSPWSRSYKDFKEHMGHVLFYCGIKTHVNGRPNPKYTEFKKQLRNRTLK